MVPKASRNAGFFRSRMAHCRTSKNPPTTLIRAPKTHLNRASVMHLTDIAIRALPHPTAGQKDYVDDLQPGLVVRVGKRTKTFMMVVAKGKNRERVTLGRYPNTSLADARSRARALIGE